MNLASFLPYVQILLSAALIGAVLLQQSDAGLGSAFGEDSLGSAHHTRRGFEKTLFNGTIVIAFLFALTSLLALIVK